MAVGKVSKNPKGGGGGYSSKINFDSHITLSPNMSCIASVVAGAIHTLTKTYQGKITIEASNIGLEIGFGQHWVVSSENLHVH